MCGKVGDGPQKYSFSARNYQHSAMRSWFSSRKVLVPHSTTYTILWASEVPSGLLLLNNLYVEMLLNLPYLVSKVVLTRLTLELPGPQYDRISFSISAHSSIILTNNDIHMDQCPRSCHRLILLGHECIFYLQEVEYCFPWPFATSENESLRRKNSLARHLCSFCLLLHGLT